jgi:hypothetical protein
MLLSVHAIGSSASAPIAEHQRRRQQWPAAAMTAGAGVLTPLVRTLR